MDILNRLPQNEQIDSNDNSLRGGYNKYKINSDFPFELSVPPYPNISIPR